MKKAMFNELLESVNEMDGIANGNKQPASIVDYPDPQIKAIREKIGLSQASLALLMGVSKRTLENWEQGRRHPTGPARALLRILEVDPKHVLKALHG